MSSHTIQRKNSSLSPRVMTSTTKKRSKANARQRKKEKEKKEKAESHRAATGEEEVREESEEGERVEEAVTREQKLAEEPEDDEQVEKRRAKRRQEDVEMAEVAKQMEAERQVKENQARQTQEHAEKEEQAKQVEAERKAEETKKHAEEARRDAEEARRRTEEAKRRAEEAEKQAKDAEQCAEEAERQAEEAERQDEEAERQAKEFTKHRSDVESPGRNSPSPDKGTQHDDGWDEDRYYADLRWYPLQSGAKISLDGNIDMLRKVLARTDPDKFTEEECRAQQPLYFAAIQALFPTLHDAAKHKRVLLSKESSNATCEQGRSRLSLINALRSSIDEAVELAVLMYTVYYMLDLKDYEHPIKKGTRMLEVLPDLQEQHKACVTALDNLIALDDEINDQAILEVRKKFVDMESREAELEFEKIQNGERRIKRIVDCLDTAWKRLEGWQLVAAVERNFEEYAQRFFEDKGAHLEASQVVAQWKEETEDKVARLREIDAEVIDLHPTSQPSDGTQEGGGHDEGGGPGESDTT